MVRYILLLGFSLLHLGLINQLPRCWHFVFQPAACLCSIAGSGRAKGSGRVGINRSLKPLGFLLRFAETGILHWKNVAVLFSAVGRVFRDYLIWRHSCETRWRGCQIHLPGFDLIGLPAMSQLKPFAFTMMDHSCPRCRKLGLLPQHVSKLRMNGFSQVQSQGWKTVMRRKGRTRQKSWHPQLQPNFCIYDICKIEVEAFHCRPRRELVFDSLTIGRQSEGRWKAAKAIEACHLIRSIMRLCEHLYWQGRTRQRTCWQVGMLTSWHMGQLLVSPYKIGYHFCKICKMCVSFVQWNGRGCCLLTCQGSTLRMMSPYFQLSHSPLQQLRSCHQ